MLTGVFRVSSGPGSTVNVLTDFAVAIFHVERVRRRCELDSPTVTGRSILLLEAFLWVLETVWGLCLPLGCFNGGAVVHSTNGGLESGSQTSAYMLGFVWILQVRPESTIS